MVQPEQVQKEERTKVNQNDFVEHGFVSINKTNPFEPNAENTQKLAENTSNKNEKKQEEQTSTGSMQNGFKKNLGDSISVIKGFSKFSYNELAFKNTKGFCH